MSEQYLPHCLTLHERNELTITGVTEVIRFDDVSVIMQTALGTLVVEGQQLQLKTLTLEGGNVTVHGQIRMLSYEEPRAAGGWFSRWLP